MSTVLEDLLFNTLKLQPAECSGKVVVVTGAGRSIGEQVARAFAWLGAEVVIAELSTQGQRVADTICQAGGKALFVQTDVSDSASVNRLAQTVHHALGPVSILVNNAIRIADVLVVDMDEALWDSILAVNLRGTFLTSKTFLPDMLMRRDGAIINMVSTEAMPGLSAYIASKQGILGLSQSMALEVGPAGVKVIPFAPGMVDTPGIRGVSGSLAPRLGMIQDAFLNLSLYPAYEGLMPPEHAGAATAYLALRLASEFHGLAVTGYEVLERAGYLKPAAEMVAQIVDPLEEESPKVANRLIAADVVRQASAVGDIVAETAREFEKLPAFVRPLAWAGFKSKAGASLNDWQKMLASHQQDIAQLAQTLGPRLEKLVVYYQGVPAETARFTRDKVMLDEVSCLSQQRIQAIQELIRLLAGYS